MIFKKPALLKQIQLACGRQGSTWIGACRFDSPMQDTLHGFCWEFSLGQLASAVRVSAFVMPICIPHTAITYSYAGRFGPSGGSYFLPDDAEGLSAVWTRMQQDIVQHGAQYLACTTYEKFLALQERNKEGTDSSWYWHDRAYVLAAMGKLDAAQTSAQQAESLVKKTRRAEDWHVWLNSLESLSRALRSGPDAVSRLMIANRSLNLKTFKLE